MQGERNNPVRIGDLELQVVSGLDFDNHASPTFIDKPLSDPTVALACEE
ncbi:MAG: hypothetical protein ACT4OT_00655 [Acidobacteriota bacterium]